MLLIKEKSDRLTEEMLQNLVGNYIYVPHNPFKGQDENINLWFGGQLIGYEVCKLFYDFQSQEIVKEADITYSAILSDGAGFAFSNECEIHLVTEEEFTELILTKDVNSP